MKFLRMTVVISWGLLLNGCAVLASNPYFEPSASVPVTGNTGHGGLAYLRFGGQNMIMTTGKPVDVGVKSGGYIGGYVPMAVGPILPIFPLFLTAPDQPDPVILLQLYIRPNDYDAVINPKAITVQNSKGVTFRPVRALGPVKPHSIPLNLVDVTYDKEEALQPGSDVRIKRGKAYCFLLQYDMGSSPDWNISMQVDGIKAGSHEYPPERFEFRRGSAVYLIWGGREELCADID